LTRNVDMAASLSARFAGKRKRSVPDFRETLRSDREACCELAQQRQHSLIF
jgi:hypothetical protein